MPPYDFTGSRSVANGRPAPFPRAAAIVGMFLKLTGGIAAALVAAGTFSLAACGTGGAGDLLGGLAGGALGGGGDGATLAADAPTATDIRDFVLAADKLTCTPESVHQDVVRERNTFRDRVLALEADREILSEAVRGKADAVATIPDTVTTVGAVVDIIIRDLVAAQDRADAAEAALADIRAAMSRAAGAAQGDAK